MNIASGYPGYYGGGSGSSSSANAGSMNYYQPGYFVPSGGSGANA
jgi:hypothetical protein